jgi:hypothetical protein
MSNAWYCEVHWVDRMLTHNIQFVVLRSALGGSYADAQYEQHTIPEYKSEASAIQLG